MLSETILNHIQHLGMSQSQEPIQILLEMSQLFVAKRKASLPVNILCGMSKLDDFGETKSKDMLLVLSYKSKHVWGNMTCFLERIWQTNYRYTQITTIPSCITNGWKRKMVPFEKKFVYLIGLLVMCIQSHWHPNNLLILLASWVHRYSPCPVQTPKKIPRIFSLNLNLVPKKYM